MRRRLEAKKKHVPIENLTQTTVTLAWLRPRRGCRQSLAHKIYGTGACFDIATKHIERNNLWRFGIVWTLSFLFFGGDDKDLLFGLPFRKTSIFLHEFSSVEGFKAFVC